MNAGIIINIAVRWRKHSFLDLHERVPQDPLSGYIQYFNYPNTKRKTENKVSFKSCD